MSNPSRWQSLVLALAVLWGGVTATAGPTTNKTPRQVRAYAQLVKLLKRHQPRYFAKFRTGLAVMANSLAEIVPGATGQGSAAYSATIVQTAGVDEGDKVKTDGTYIYELNRSRVLIIHAYPDTALQVVCELDFTDGSFYPQELYLDSQFLVVVGTAFRSPPQPYPWEQPVTGSGPVWYYSTSTVQAKVYDIAVPGDPAKVREVEIEGNYVATRKIGSVLYLVSRQYPAFYTTGLASLGGEPTGLPSLRDTARGKGFRSLSLADFYFLPGFDDPDFLVVAAVDLSHPDADVNAQAYLGAGDQVYASRQSLYVSASRRFDLYLMEPLALAATAAVTSGPATADAAGRIADLVPAPALPEPFLFPEESTDLYKFTLNKGHPAFVGTHNVPGTIQNSYSMDEDGDYFRVATALHGGWWDGSSQTSNNVFVLDAAMNRVGSLEGIAPGEEIYAARFVGNRLFLVTFERIDPLFAIDLSDPTRPAIVGQLTLPGYSQFLLPYDENHLIGIGKDVAIARAGTAGGDVPWWDGRAFYQGLKLALFDVTDLNHPAELYSVGIGDRGTDSPALWDPHAILFDRSINLFALPVSVATVTNPDPANPWQWGTPVFQGAYVYHVSPETGFVLQGTVTHVPGGADVGSGYDQQIDRVLYIGSDLYTLSAATLKANDLDTLAEKATLDLPPPPPIGPIPSVPPSKN